MGEETLCSECSECWFLWGDNKWGCHFEINKEIATDARILEHDIYVEQSDYCPKSKLQCK